MGLPPRRGPPPRVGPARCRQAPSPARPQQQRQRREQASTKKKCGDSTGVTPRQMGRRAKRKVGGKEKSASGGARAARRASWLSRARLRQRRCCLGREGGGGGMCACVAPAPPSFLRLKCWQRGTTDGGGTRLAMHGRRTPLPRPQVQRIATARKRPLATCRSVSQISLIPIRVFTSHNGE